MGAGEKVVRAILVGSRWTRGSHVGIQIVGEYERVMGVSSV